MNSFSRTKNYTPISRPSNRNSAGRFTLMLVPEGTGTSLKLSLSKISVFVFLFVCIATLGGMAALIINYSHMREITMDYEKVKAENHSLRSEANAIYSKLQDVQVVLNNVDKFSNQIRKTTGNDSLKIRDQGKKSKKNERSLKESTYFPAEHQPMHVLGGIGPISKKDFEIATNSGLINPINSAINYDKLEFKNIFEALLNIGLKSTSQAKELERLLNEVKVYQTKISITPTLMPVIGYISSSFGVRQSPFSGESQMHWGLDIASNYGVPIRASAAGKVTIARYAEDYGNYVEIEHGQGVVTRYGHCKSLIVRPGDKVEKGDIIALVGNTGRTTGPHVHFEIEIAGRRIDPEKYIKTSY